MARAILVFICDIEINFDMYRWPLWKSCSNFSLTFASDPGSGWLRDDLELRQHTLELLNLSLRHEPSPCHGAHLPSWFSCTNSEHRSAGVWNTRAWTLQGGLLSTRILIFSEHEVYWTCKSVTATGTFPKGLDPLVWESIYGTREQHTTDCSCQSLKPSNLANLFGMHNDIAIYDLWSAVVAHYTSMASCKTRNDEEVSSYPSLLRIAKKLNTVIKDNLLLGLWEKSLSWSLLWWIEVGLGDTPGALTSRHKAFGFPSWSWFGLRGTVRMPRYVPGRSLIDVLKAEVTNENFSIPGSLIVRGPVSTVYLVQSTDKATPILQIPLSLSSKSKPDMFRVPAYFDNWLSLDTTSIPLFAFWVWLSGDKTSSQIVIRAVLLKKDDNSSDDTFRRCGICELPFPPRATSDHSAANFDFLKTLMKEIKIV